MCFYVFVLNWILCGVIFGIIFIVIENWWMECWVQSLFGVL